ncbi:MAG TPA: methyltransferase domain-containing protein, partial [Lysobacter sp.]|nr:methyltransferase domain-containing protein [Lysobacter sp.]
YRDDPALRGEPPGVVVDLGCGPGRAAAAMQKRWPKARVLALDLALPMLREARASSKRGINLFARRPQPVCADARALPLAENSVDVLFSNLCLQWVEDLGAVFAGFRRVLKPRGQLLLSTFGPDTLWELREAFARADDAPHVSPFADIAGVGDALVRAGFHQPVLEREVETTAYPDLAALMRELRALGATNALSARRHTLTGRARFAVAERAYEPLRRDGNLPASWETITAMAWAPEAGAPIREGEMEIARFPANAIPVRRR